jgi:XTP/dITP diphosphohydrolase
LRKIVIATSNEHKLKEIIYILAGLPLQFLSLNNFPELEPIQETGKNFKENALIKAKTLFDFTGMISLGEDSGLEVDVLKGAPGIFSARYAGKTKNDLANNRKLLRELKNIPDEERGAQFKCVVGIVGPSLLKVVEGKVKGRIVQEMRGKTGFGYDPLFIPEGYNKTFAELGDEEKNKISHRAAAFKKVKKVIEKSIL